MNDRTDNLIKNLDKDRKKQSIKFIAEYMHPVNLAEDKNNYRSNSMRSASTKFQQEIRFIIRMNQTSKQVFT